jgi:hypothetical protein
MAYNEDQPRDEKGQWTSEGGGGQDSKSESKSFIETKNHGEIMKDTLKSLQHEANAKENWQRGKDAGTLKDHINEFKSGKVVYDGKVYNGKDFDISEDDLKQPVKSAESGDSKETATYIIFDHGHGNFVKSYKKSY